MRRRVRCVACAIGLVMVVSVRSAESETLSLLWDASPDASAVGYVVYIGTEPGRPLYEYDVGSSLLFQWDGAIDGQQYYLSVASYERGAGGAVIGPRSREVSRYPAIDPPDNGSVVPPEDAVTPLHPPTSTPQPESPVQQDHVAEPASPASATPPTLTITVPTTDGFHSVLRQSVIMLGGTAIDDYRVSRVEWSSDRGFHGAATGSDIWIAAVPLRSGLNQITVKAYDDAGNAASRSISVQLN